MLQRCQLMQDIHVACRVNIHLSTAQPLKARDASIWMRRSTKTAGRETSRALEPSVLSPVPSVLCRVRLVRAVRWVRSATPIGFT